MNKKEAYEYAKNRVKVLSEEKNDEGYPKYSLSAEQIITLEIRIAEWLYEHYDD